MVLHPRGLVRLLRPRTEKWAVTVLTGSRQTGKTTLVRDLLRPRDGQGPPIYFSLDDPDERLRLGTDAVRRLDHPGKLVILDEIQKQPSLLDAVKLLADRRRGNRFLLLGSSQILLLRQLRESLAGRATLLELWPLALGEKVGGDDVPETGLDRVWKDGEEALREMAARPPSVEHARHWRALAEDHLRWGGYPSLEPLPADDRSVWLRDYRRTYLERDLSDLGRVADLDQFAMAQSLLAARTAQILSYSEVARDLGVAVNTVKRYVRFLEISYQAILLPPLLPNLTTRLVKSPKFYWTDVGLARLLSERHSLSDGPLFETAVLGDLLRWGSWQTDPPHLCFFRTHGGREVDFVLQTKRGVLAVEAKGAPRAHRADARALTDFLDLPPPPAAPGVIRLGLVVTSGQEVEPLAPRVWAVPYWRLFGPNEA
jgi:predicted AAA+ superfamily ATPase